MDAVDEVQIPRVIAVARRSRWSFLRIRRRRARARRMSASVRGEVARGERASSHLVPVSAR
jgi:hypothetical protein